MSLTDDLAHLDEDRRKSFEEIVGPDQNALRIAWACFRALYPRQRNLARALLDDELGPEDAEMLARLGCLKEHDLSSE